MLSELPLYTVFFVLLLGLLFQSTLCDSELSSQAICIEPTNPELFTCKPGEEAGQVSQLRSIPRLVCRSCPHHQFQPCKNQIGESCKDKKLCNNPHMILIDIGSARNDAICACEEGFTMLRDASWCEDAGTVSPPFITPSGESAKTTSDSRRLKEEWQIPKTDIIIFVSLPFCIVIPSALGVIGGYCFQKRRRKRKVTEYSKVPVTDVLQNGLGYLNNGDLEVDAIASWESESHLVTSHSTGSHPVYPPLTPNQSIDDPGPGQERVHQTVQPMPELPVPGPAVGPLGPLGAPAHAAGIAPVPAPAPALANVGGIVPIAGAQPAQGAAAIAMQDFNSANSESLERDVHQQPRATVSDMQDTPFGSR